VDTNWLVNGEATAVDPADRGLAYGDGLFETMAADGGEIRWLAYHLQRLAAGCAVLGFPAPAPALIRGDIERLVPQSGACVVKLIVTRGVGVRGYRPPAVPRPTRLLGVGPRPDAPPECYTQGIAVQTCRLRLGENPALAGLKHLNRLEQVLAQMELAGSGVDEGLLLDCSGFVVGGTTCNLFAVVGGEIVTPSIERCGVRGVMRRAVIESCAALGRPVRVTDMPLAACYDAEELFVTNAVFGIRPVRRLDSCVFGVGETTRQLQSRLGYASSA
jgi:4-amino-4-deoxychorismate lyase